LHPDVAEHLWHTQIKPLRSFPWWTQNRSALQPFAWKRDRADRAPSTPEERNSNKNQNSPPCDPHEHDTEVMTSDRRADQPCKNGEYVSDQHNDKDCQLWITAFESVLYEGAAGKFDLCHDELCFLSHRDDRTKYS